MDQRGKAKFSGGFSPEAIALIAAIKPEIDEICDRFNIPRIRAIGSVRSDASAIAKMGGGVMYFNPTYFNDWASGGTKGGTTVDYDPKVTFADRPHNTFRYYSTGIDRARSVMYHEIGHHLHTMGLPNQTDAYGKPVVDADGNSLAYLNDTQIEKWLEENDSSFRSLEKKDGLPSRYAATNRFEWLCENLSEYFMGNTDRVAPEAISLIESLLLKGDISDA